MQCVEDAKITEEALDGSTLFYLTSEVEEPPQGDPWNCQINNSGTTDVDEGASQENTDCGQATEEVEPYYEFILNEVEIEMEAQQTLEGLSAAAVV